MLKLLEAVSKFFSFWSRARVKYNNSKDEGGVSLGVGAIICSLFSLVMVVGCCFGFTILWGHFTGIELGGTYEFPVFSLIGLVFIVAITLFTFVQGVLYALVLMIYQFRLNAGFGFFTLFIWLASIGGMLAAAYFIVL